MALVACTTFAALTLPGHGQLRAEPVTTPAPDAAQSARTTTRAEYVERLFEHIKASASARSAMQHYGIYGDFTTRVIFTAHPDGRFTDIKIQSSSGNPVVDKIAEVQMQRASPGPVFAKSMRRTRQSFSLGINVICFLPPDTVPAMRPACDD